MHCRQTLEKTSVNEQNGQSLSSMLQRKSRSLPSATHKYQIDFLYLLTFPVPQYCAAISTKSTNFYFIITAVATTAFPALANVVG